jgi:hypothetical protein
MIFTYPRPKLILLEPQLFQSKVHVSAKAVHRAGMEDEGFDKLLNLTHMVRLQFMYLATTITRVWRANHDLLHH